MNDELDRARSYGSSPTFTMRFRQVEPFGQHSVFVPDNSAGNRVQPVTPAVDRAHRNLCAEIRFVLQLIDDLRRFSFCEKKLFSSHVELCSVVKTNFGFRVAGRPAEPRQHHRRDDSNDRRHRKQFQ